MGTIPVAAMQQATGLDRHAAFVRGLCSPAAYPHAPAIVEHLETHISHVFLTGSYAYKIKKPLELGFLDFSSLDKRRFYCEEELRINRRLAPDLYLEVVPISGTPEAPRVEGRGPVLEHAVKMRQFSQASMLEQVLARGELTAAMIDELTRQVARFHAGLPPAGPEDGYGSPGSIMGPALQNFTQLAPLVDPAQRAVLTALNDWTERQHATLAPLFAQRQREGCVRECHGDLHLGNMVLIDGAVRIFDGIEFNPQLRWIDVMNEVAFLGMDLVQRGRGDLAYRFINGYLEHSGDYLGVRLLRYYLAYRALVRAKVAAMRAVQATTPNAQRQALQVKCRTHIALAERVTTERKPALIIHHGLSGSGKTTCSQTMLEAIGAIRIRSDVERRRMHGLAPGTRTDAAVAGGIYGAQATQATYDRLANLSEAVLGGGFPVLVDATFLRRAQREAFRRLAARLAVPFVIADFVSSVAVLRERVSRRQQTEADASEAGVAVLEHQLRSQEPLSPDEEAAAVRFDTEHITADAIRSQAQRLVASAAACT